MIDNEECYQKLFRSSPAVMLIVEQTTGSIVDANQAAIAFYGYDLDELRSMQIFDINIAEPEIIKGYMAKVSNDYGKPIPFQHRLKNGSVREIEVYSSPVRVKERIVLHSIIIDITDKKRIEKLYLESEKRLREFAEATLGTSFIMDEDGQYIEVFDNQKIFHIPKEKLLGQTIHQVLQAEDARFVLNKVRQVIASGQPQTGLHEFQLGQEKRYLSGRIVPLSYIVNGKKSVAIIATDVTEQRRTENILQVSYELRRRSDLINDILNGRVDNEENIAYLSSKLGLDLSLPIFVCNFLSEKIENNYIHSQEKRMYAQRFKDIMINELNNIPNFVAWDCREGIGVLCQGAFGNEEWKKSKELAALIKEKLLEYDSSISISLGVSDVHIGIQGLKKSCQQALSAAIAARCQAGGETDIVHYREAGIFQFIPDPYKGEAVKEYIEGNIGKLIAYDQAKKSNYLATLEEFLRGSSVREAADKQYLHPKTIVFRQKRIANILNVDLDAYQTRLALAIALQLHKLYTV